MKRVILESPYGGDIERNIRYARACVADCLQRDELPIASHLLYTQEGILYDCIPDQRALGMRAGHAWIGSADLMVVYCDHGISQGMIEGMMKAQGVGLNIELRRIGDHR